MEHLPIENNFQILPDGSLVIKAFGGNHNEITINQRLLNSIRNVSLLQTGDLLELQIPYGDFIDVANSIKNSIGTLQDEEDNKKLYKVLVLYFFSKAWMTFESIHLLCINKFGQDVTILLRSLLDLVVNARYIAEDPSSRAKLFAEYEIIEKRNFHNALVEYSKAHPTDPWIKRVLSRKDTKDLEAEDKQYRKVEKIYGKQSWSGLTLKDMAGKVKLDFHYILYKMMCKVAHTSSEGVNSYCSIDAKAITFFAAGDEDIQRSWFTTCLYFLVILDLANDVFGLRFEGKIKACGDLVHKLKSALKEGIS